MDIVVSEDFICCRYCGHFFHEYDLPLFHKSEYDVETGRYKDVTECYQYRRCPSCLHVLDYDVSSSVPSAVVWRMQYRINPNTGRLEFRNERRYLRRI